MKEAVGEVKTIHSKVIEHIGVDGATALLQVAHALRTGLIEKHKYNQNTIGDIYNCYGSIFMHRMNSCGSACCIIGWTKAFTTREVYEKITNKWDRSVAVLPPSEQTITRILANLFAAGHPSDPQKAANAIEAFVYDYAATPWSK